MTAIRTSQAKATIMRKKRPLTELSAPEAENAEDTGKAMSQYALRDRLAVAPERPGVYLFKDARGRVLYVGKAASLRQRLRSYTQPGPEPSPKIVQLMPRVADFEYIITESAQEALLLENTLIKEHQPRFNIRLKDDKTYPYIKVDLADPFPRVLFTRRVENDGGRYFGPYSSASSVRRTLDLLKRLFPYRSCTRIIAGQDPRPCLDFYIHRCVAPCIGEVDQESYRQVIEQVLLFLEGKQQQVVRELRKEMGAAAARLEYERAAILRDQLRAVERVMERQKVVSLKGKNEDAIAFSRDGDEACVQVFFIRGGTVLGHEPFLLEGVQEEEPGTILASFLQQFYLTVPSIPPRLLLQYSVPEAETLEEWLSQRRRGAVRIVVPRRGPRRQLIAMAEENAREALAQRRAQWLADRSKTATALAELEEALALPRLPQRVECYDISNLQGSNAVGSMVVFENGQPKRAHYRRFQIKEVAGIDDYAMMREVLRRRFRRARADDGQAPSTGSRQESPAETGQAVAQHDGQGTDDSFPNLPDLVLIDGGRGHLTAASEALRELDLTELPVAALAKENEEVYLPHMAEPLILPRTSQALYLLQRLRDEAHRFAITYHRTLRSKRTIKSGLDAIPGIGPRRRRLLLRSFGSLQRIREASVDQISALPGITRPLAERILAALGH